MIDLKAGGLDLKDVVASEVWMTNVSQFNAMHEAYRTIFPIDPPARIKMVGVESLGTPTSLIEIALIAVK